MQLQRLMENEIGEYLERTGNEIFRKVVSDIGRVFDEQLEKEFAKLRKGQGELKGREEALEQREQKLREREQKLQQREEIVARNDKNLTEKEADFMGKLNVMKAREKKMVEKDAEAEARDKALKKKEEKVAEMEAGVAGREKGLKQLEKKLMEKEVDLANREEEAARLKAENARKQVWAPMDQVFEGLLVNATESEKCDAMRLKKIAGVFGRSGVICMRIKELQEYEVGVRTPASKDVQFIASASGIDIGGCIRGLIQKLLGLVRSNHPTTGGKMSVCSKQA